MKQLILVGLLLPAFVSAQQGFLIKGTVSNVPDTAAIFLTDANRPTDTLAQTMAKGGVFELKGKVSEPNLYMLNFGGAQKKTVLFIGNDQVTVKGDVNNIQELQVSGSAVHNDFIAFQDTFNPLFKRLQELSEPISAASGNVSESDTLMIAYRKQVEKISTAIDQFVTSKKSSPIAPFLMLVTFQVDQDPLKLEKRFNQLSQPVQQGFYGKMLKEQIDNGKIGAIGTEAIAFTQNDTTGNPVSLASFRGKYVLVDFWASWCKPCRMENPNVVSAYKKFNDKNFTVLGVSLDREKESWLQAIRDDQLTWTHVSDLQFWNNDVAKAYRIESIPQNILIDPNGKIIGKNLRGEQLQSRLCELLGCN